MGCGLLTASVELEADVEVEEMRREEELDETDKERTWWSGWWRSLVAEGARKEEALEEAEDEDVVGWQWWLASSSWDASSEQVDEAEADAEDVRLGEADDSGQIEFTFSVLLVECFFSAKQRVLVVTTM
jgi:hypothetical protein